MLEHAPQATFVERAVMGHKRQSFDGRGYFLPYHGKRIGIDCIVIGQSVYVRSPVTIIIRGRTYQLIKRIGHLLFLTMTTPTQHTLVR